MKRSYPFDPFFKHHLIIALGLAIWVFVFLYFTEPLDVNEFGDKEKLLYLPIYGVVAAVAYLLMMPFQNWYYKRNQIKWSMGSEILFFFIFILGGFILSRSAYLYIIMRHEPNPYTFNYYTLSIYLPAISTILPIVLIGRWGFGKYHEKRLEDQKIEIEGEGAFEGLRLPMNDVICIKADDNYIEVTYLNGGILKKQLIRNKLTAVAESLPELQRTHRSYLINPYHFQQWKSDNGKQYIGLGYEIFAPVSKTYASTLKTLFNSTTK